MSAYVNPSDKKTDELLDDDNNSVKCYSCYSKRMVFTRHHFVRCFKKFTSLLLLLCIVFMGSIYLGAYVEDLAIAAVPPSVRLDTAEKSVCGISNPRNVTATAKTYLTVSAAVEAGETIVHCMDCGACSTFLDMKVMTFAQSEHPKDNTHCSFLEFLVGQDTVSWCRNNVVSQGFTNECQQCFTNHVLCSFRNCKYTCMKQTFWGTDKETHDETGQSVHSCWKCEETMCGPEFRQCSGANRQRMGIVSNQVGWSDAMEPLCVTLDYDWIRGVKMSRRPPTLNTAVRL